MPYGKHRTEPETELPLHSHSGSSIFPVRGSTPPRNERGVANASALPCA